MIQATKTPKKVLYLITKATWGGAQRYVYDLATNLPSEYETVVAYGTGGKLSDDLQAAHVRTIQIPSLRRDVALFSDISSFFGILRCIRAERPDVLHLNSSKAAALGALAGRLCGVKRIVFTAHGWPFKESRNTLSKTGIFIVSWLTTALSHAVVVVSKEDERLGLAMRGMSKKIRYIPIGIEPPAFLSRDEIQTSLRIPAGSPRLVTIAELTRNKGLRYAIEAVALLKEKGVYVSYSIIGDGELKEELQQLVREKHLEDQVWFPGFMTDAAKNLRAFDIFILPSIKEGMPYVLLEAAFADMPIIATAVIDPGFFDRYQCLRAIKPGDAVALASAIKDVDMHPEYKDYPALEAMAQATIRQYQIAPTSSV